MQVGQKSTHKNYYAIWIKKIINLFAIARP